MRYIALVLLLISNIAIATSQTSKNSEVIYIKAEIYQVPVSELQANIESQLKVATLQHTRKIVSFAGQTESIEFKAQDKEQIKLQLVIEDEVQFFDLEFQLSSRAIRRLAR